jgi:Ser-tRNA(Ala) deacylase AlaX
MNSSLIIGQQYIITKKYVNPDVKPPMEVEMRVEVLDKLTDNLVLVKILTGRLIYINKTRKIPIDNYNFEKVTNIYKEVNDTVRWANQVNADIIKKVEEFETFKNEVKSKLEEYNKIKSEVIFLRIAFLVIIYMYIMGVIKMK